MRHLLLLALLFLAAALQAQEEPDSSAIVSAEPYELFMQFKGRGYSQGGACYGKYLFVGNQGNLTVDVYDLEEKISIGSMSMPGAHPVCHANTLNFGPRFYKEGDEFPLLYISSGNNFEPGVPTSMFFVYRIERGKTPKGKLKFTASLIQRIFLDGFRGCTECITDNEQEALWIRCGHGSKQLAYLKFPIPDERNDYVTLVPSAAVDSFFVDDVGPLCYSQGCLCHDGYIYFPAGFPTKVPYLAGISLEKRDYEYIVNLNEVEDIRHTRLSEPEYIFYYEGDYFIGFRKYIYRIDMELIKKANYFFKRYRLTH